MWRKMLGPHTFVVLPAAQVEMPTAWRNRAVWDPEKKLKPAASDGGVMPAGIAPRPETRMRGTEKVLG